MVTDCIKPISLIFTWSELLVLFFDTKRKLKTTVFYWIVSFIKNTEFLLTLRSKQQRFLLVWPSLGLTVAPVEGAALTVSVMEDPAGVQLSFHPAPLAQAQGAAAAVTSALLLLWAAHHPLCHLSTVHLPAHHGPLRRVAAQQADQRGQTPRELLRGGGQQGDWGADCGASCGGSRDTQGAN